MVDASLRQNKNSSSQYLLKASRHAKKLLSYLLFFRSLTSMHALRLLFPRHWRPVLSIQNFPHAASLQRQQLILGIFFPETFLYTFILHLPGKLIITISSFAHEV